jgi:hypothetical protein
MKTSFEKIAFMNLGLDQNFDKLKLLQTLFPARVPASERLILSQLDMSLYSVSHHGLAIGFQKPEADLLSWLEGMKVRVPRMLSLKTNPYFITQWLEELKAELVRLDYDILGATAELAGLSSLESELIDTYKLRAAKYQRHSIDFFSRVNSKSFLADLCLRWGCPFPRTILTNTRSLNREIEQWTGQFPLFIKYNHSSGGGGSFEISDKKDISFIKYIDRHKSDLGDGIWLLQEKILARKQFSCLCEANATLSLQSVMEVEYNSHGYSSRHKLASPSEIIDFLPELSGIADRIVGVLEGYQGPFGFDAILSDNGDLYPIIDLNIRMNKGHLILKAAEQFQIESADIYSVRIRETGFRFSSFAELWGQICQRLNLDEQGQSQGGQFVIPYLTSGIVDPSLSIITSSQAFREGSSLRSPVELTCFFGHKNSPEEESIRWRERAIGEISKVMKGRPKGDV